MNGPQTRLSRLGSPMLIPLDQLEDHMNHISIRNLPLTLSPSLLERNSLLFYPLSALFPLPAHHLGPLTKQNPQILHRDLPFIWISQRAEKGGTFAIAENKLLDSILKILPRLLMRFLNHQQPLVPSFAHTLKARLRLLSIGLHNLFPNLFVEGMIIPQQEVIPGQRDVMFDYSVLVQVVKVERVGGFIWVGGRGDGGEAGGDGRGEV